MAALSIRDLDDDVKQRLRMRAAGNGRSMESEVRAILTDAVRDPGPADGLFAALLERFGQLDGVELDLPARGAAVRGADFAA